MSEILRPGTAVGDFEIEEFLAAGAMGHVYAARQCSLGRRVALKIIPDELMPDAEAQTRFLNEAMITASLDHPNIVTAYAAGNDDGLCFLAMQYIDGRDLMQIVEDDGPLAESDVWKICHVVSNALEYAWRKCSIIHRDIKPSNIKLASDGTPYLLDLGIAKQTESDSSLTMSGYIVGTPHYMSPEQAQGSRDLDVRSDIYGLGATLYHLATGQPPYDADTAVGVLTKLNTAPVPDPQAVAPELSDTLASLIQLMMQKRRETRPQDWPTIQDAVTKYRSDGALPVAKVIPNIGSEAPDDTVSPSSSRGRWGTRIAGCMAIGIVVGLTGLALVVSLWNRALYPDSDVAVLPLSEPEIAAVEPETMETERMSLDDELVRLERLAAVGPGENQQALVELDALHDRSSLDEQALIEPVRSALRNRHQQNIDAIVEQIEHAADAADAAGNQSEALAMYRYNGPLAKEVIPRLDPKRMAREKHYAKMREDMAVKKQWFEHRQTACRAIVAGHFEDAVRTMTVALQAPLPQSLQKEAREYAKTVHFVSTLEEKTAATFRRNMGKMTRIALHDKVLHLEVLDVRGTTIVVGKNTAHLGHIAREINIRDLAYDERLKRIPAGGTHDVIIARALVTYFSGNSADAITQLEPLRDPFSNDLRKAMLTTPAGQSSE